MPATPVDEFVVLFGLDPTQHTRGSKEVRRNTKLTRDEALTGAKDMEAAGKRAAMFFSQIKTQAVGALLAFAGASGLKNLAEQLVTTSANVGRLSTLVGTSTEELSAWQGALGKVGGKAADADSAIRAMASAYQSYKLTGSTGIDADLMGLGVTVADLESPTRALVKMAEAAERMSAPEFAARMQRIGIPESVIVLLQRGRAETERLVAEQERLYVVTEKDTAAAQRFEAAWSTLKSTIWGFVQGPLTSLLEWLTQTDKSLDSNGEAMFRLRTEQDKTGKKTGWLATQAADASSKYNHFAKSVIALQERLSALASYIGGGFKAAWKWLSDLGIFNIRYGVDAAPGAPGSNTGPATGNEIVDFFRQKGWTNEQARGIAAGIKAENGALDPTAKNPTSSAYGLGQWLTPRQKVFARVMGKPVQGSSAREQLEFIDWELRNTEAAAGRKIASARTAHEALRSYVYDNMRPGPGAPGDMVRGMRALGMRPPPMPVSPTVSQPATAPPTNIGVINVYTAATDAAGIARDLPTAVGARRVTTQANRGLK